MGKKWPKQTKIKRIDEMGARIAGLSFILTIRLKCCQSVSSACKSAVDREEIHSKKHDMFVVWALSIYASVKQGQFKLTFHKDSIPVSDSSGWEKKQIWQITPTEQFQDTC